MSGYFGRLKGKASDIKNTISTSSSNEETDGHSVSSTVVHKAMVNYYKTHNMELPSWLLHNEERSITNSAANNREGFVHADVNKARQPEQLRPVQHQQQPQIQQQRASEQQQRYQPQEQQEQYSRNARYNGSSISNQLVNPRMQRSTQTDINTSSAPQNQQLSNNTANHLPPSQGPLSRSQSSTGPSSRPSRFGFRSSGAAETQGNEPATRSVSETITYSSPTKTQSVSESSSTNTLPTRRFAVNKWGNRS